MSSFFGSFDITEDVGDFIDRIDEVKSVVEMESAERAEVRKALLARIQVPDVIWVPLPFSDIEANITNLILIREEKGVDSYHAELQRIHEWGVNIVQTNAAERDWRDVARDVGSDLLEQFIPLPPEVGLVVDIVADATRAEKAELADILEEKRAKTPPPATVSGRSRRTMRHARKRAARLARVPPGLQDKPDKMWYGQAGLRRRRASPESFAPEMEAEPIDVPTVTQPMDPRLRFIEPGPNVF